MKIKFLFLIFICIATASTGLAEDKKINSALDGILTGTNNAAPLPLSKLAFPLWSEWLDNIGVEYINPFAEKLFTWFEKQKDIDLPAEVAQDPEHIFIQVDQAIKETDELENRAIDPIPRGITYGGEIYSIMLGNIDECLAVFYYRKGLPFHQAEGSVQVDFDSAFRDRVEYFAPNPEWGENAFVNLTLRRGVGIVHDVRDRYVIIQRGDAKKGYELLVHFFHAADKTPNTSTLTSMVMIQIQPIAEHNDICAFKMNFRHLGQSYNVLGNIGVGRHELGFNTARLREEQLKFNNMVKEYHDNGKNAGQ